MAYKKFSESKVLMSKLKTYCEDLPEDEEQLEALFYKVARNNIKSFGDKLKQARLEYGGAQSGMANFLNVRQATFSDWENGKNLPRIHYLKELLAVYNIDPSDLIDVNPLKIVNDSFIPLVDSSLFLSKRYEDFEHDLERGTNFHKIPVSISENLSFALCMPDSSMFGGDKPIYDNSVLLCSTKGLKGKSSDELFLFCDNKICVVNICGEEPLIRLLKYDDNVLSLIALNEKWTSYSFPDEKEYLKNLDDVKCCIYKEHETYSNSVKIFGIVKKMYVDF